MKEKQIFQNLSDEIMMSAAQTDEFWRSQGAPAMLAYAENREYPIHRADVMPMRANEHHDGEGLTDVVRPGEVYAFQVVIYAGETLHNVRALGAQCINMGGRDCKGQTLEKRIDIPKGRIQSLWFLMNIPENASGEINTEIVLSADNVSEKKIALSLRAEGSVISEHGDEEPWRLSRLRWLDSDYAIDDYPTAPFLPVALNDNTISVLGRKIRLGGGSLPSSVESYFENTNETIGTYAKEVLAAPMSFTALGDAGAVSLSGAAYSVVKQAPGVVAVSASKESDDMILTVNSRIEFDGYMEYRIRLTAKRGFTLRDARLSIPYKNAKYAMGLGVQGGLRKGEISFTFAREKNQDTLWMGEVNAGLMLRLRDGSYEKPYMLIYYHDHPLHLPESWHNEGRGGVTVDEHGSFTAFGGERNLCEGQTLDFDFDLCVTPVKPLARAAHYMDHYYHARPDSLKQVAESGANIINLHHGNRYNPFINTPCFETEALRKYAKACHDVGLRVKIYYTIKELSVRAPEFFAYLSLNGEVLPAPGSEYPSWQGPIPYADEWIERVIGKQAITAWRQKVNDGDYVDEMEASLMVAPMSRFNNFFIENIRWLLDHTAIDGLYFDDTAYERSIMMRVRKTLDRHHPGTALDLHSWNYYKDNTVDDSSLAGHGNSMNLYIDQAAFLDSIWFGEGFDYRCSPDVWLIEMSGIPFGLMGDMLQDGGDRYMGMLFGMTCRLPNKYDPSGIHRFRRKFGMENASMRGFWNPDCPISCDKDGVYATAFVRADGALIALVNRSGHDVQTALNVDYAALGLDEAACAWSGPEVDGFQQAFDANPKAVTLKNGDGCLLWVRE